MRPRFLLSALMATTALSPVPLAADPGRLPTGGTVVHGDVGIARSGRAMDITQGSSSAIVDWRGFSIGADARVTIHQPGADARMLNRVTGQTTSAIHGRLDATGQVFLINPNGIVIGPGGRVTAAGFVASSLPMANEDFLAGRDRFEGSGASAAVRNHGTVDIVPGGYAALLGGRVANTGTIRVPAGRVGLGAGERVTLDFSGDGFLQVALPSEVDGDEALITHSGRIEAGQVEMQAATAREAARNAINLSGVVEARSVSGRNGAVTLGGGGGGSVQVGGRVSTRATGRQPVTARVERSPIPPARPTGGDITITGNRIALEGAEIDAGGAGGGGRIRIGGDLQGQGELPRARSLAVDGATTIRADALELGDGGTIILWSEDLTEVAGSLSARGGPEGGDGGFIEVSAREVLRYLGTASALAPRGTAGTLLLDPRNIAIVTEAADTPEGFSTILVEVVEQSLDNFATVIVDTADFPPIGDVDTDVLEPVGPSDPEPGDIRVLGALGWDGGATLLLRADNDISLEAPITATLGALALDAGGTVTTGPAGDVRIGRFELLAGDWVQTGPDLPAFEAGDFRLREAPLPGSTGLFDTLFLRVAGGSGTEADPYILTDVYGLQGIDTAALVGASFVLGNDIDAGVTAGWADGRGFNPIGDAAATDRFGGTLDGAGFTISGLTSNRSTAALFDITLGASIRDLTLRDMALTGTGRAAGIAGVAVDSVIDGVDVIGDISVTGSLVGGIAGQLFGGTLNDSRFDGRIDATAVSGSPAAVGGLVGVNTGEIRLSAAQADITFLRDADADIRADFVGGVAGENRGTVALSSFGGRIDAVRNGAPVNTLRIGGLAGDNRGVIDSSAVGAEIVVTNNAGPLLLGGAVGDNFIGTLIDTDVGGRIEVTQRTGTGVVAIGGFVGESRSAIEGNTTSADIAVTAPGGQELRVGGFIGDNRSRVAGALASGDVTVTTLESTGGSGRVSAGGFVGVNLQGAVISITDSVATGSVTAELDTIDDAGIGGFAGTNSALLARNIATGDVTVGARGGALGVGGFAGFHGAENINLFGGTIEDSRASGTVTVALDDGFNAAEAAVGGLAGLNASIIRRTLAEGDVAMTYGGIDSLALGAGGGLVGLNLGLIEDSAAFGGVTLSGFTESFAGGLAGVLLAGPSPYTFVFPGTPTIRRALATGPAEAETAGGLVAAVLEIDGAPTLRSGLFWDTESSGLDIGIGGTGLTTAEMQDTEGFRALAAAQGWDFDGVWAPSDAGNYATLYSISPVVWARAGVATAVYGDPLPAPGDVVGGPGVYVFGPLGDALPPEGPFLVEGDGQVGTAVIGATPTLTSLLGQTYRVVVSEGELTILPAPLVITALDAEKLYGELLAGRTATGFEAEGLRNADTVASVALASDGAPATAPVGGYALTPSDALGTGLGNYSITFRDGVLTVTPAPLVITALDADKTYGELLAARTATGFEADGLRNADTVASVALASDGAPETATVGAYALTASDALGTGLGNYSIAFRDGVLTVTPAPLVITALDADKTYGDTLVERIRPELTAGQLRNDDTLLSVRVVSDGAPAQAPVGNYTLSLTDPVGTGLGNYAIEFRDGVLTVVPAPLVITARDRQKTFGEALDLGTEAFDVAGLLNADSVTAVTLTSDGAAADAPLAGSPFAIVPSDPVGIGLGNYVIDLVNGRLTILAGPVAPPDGGGVPVPRPDLSRAIAPPPTIVDGPVLAGLQELTADTQARIAAVDTGAQSLAAAERTLGALQASAARVEAAMQGCRALEPGAGLLLECVSDALGAFATDLEALALDLPPELSQVSAIIRNAEAQVSAIRQRTETELAAATTDAERRDIELRALGDAIGVVQNAADEVRRSLELIRAEDPQLVAVFGAQGATVVQAIQTVELELVRASGI